MAMEPLEHGFLRQELALLASLKSRRTAGPSHQALVDHIYQQLEACGFAVQEQRLEMDYWSPSGPPSLEVDGQVVPVSSAVAYSGCTPAEGIKGRLVRIPSSNSPIVWEQARDCIAVVNIRNPKQNRAANCALWPGSLPWGPPSDGLPVGSANAFITDLKFAKAAGVKGVIYTWENVSTSLAEGLYAPMYLTWQCLPAVFVAGKAADAVRSASTQGKTAQLKQVGELVTGVHVRHVWTVIPGTERADETIVINTHTDGVNILQENGHIAILAYARLLQQNPPKRTTILLFVAGHIHPGAFSQSTKHITTQWLHDHPTLWKGESPEHRAIVFGSCVEHLGSVKWKEELEHDAYVNTGTPEDELLYAATPELAAMVLSDWHTLGHGRTRVIDPTVPGKARQFGEGLPFLLLGIPEVSLLMAPSYLMKEFADGFDEMSLIDFGLLEKQCQSLLRFWQMADGLPRADFGTVRSR